VHDLKLRIDPAFRGELLPGRGELVDHLLGRFDRIVAAAGAEASRGSGRKIRDLPFARIHS
jgi:hypothetical protein